MDAKTKRRIGGMAKKLDKIRVAIGKDRDALQELVDDAQGLLDSVEQGYCVLSEAVDKLSEYV